MIIPCIERRTKTKKIEQKSEKWCQRPHEFADETRQLQLYKQTKNKSYSLVSRVPNCIKEKLLNSMQQAIQNLVQLQGMQTNKLNYKILKFIPLIIESKIVANWTPIYVISKQ